MAMMVEPKGFRGGSVVKNPPSDSVSKESTCNVGNVGLIPGLGRSPGEGKGYQSTILAWRIPWTAESMGHKEFDTTGQLPRSQVFHVFKKWELVISLLILNKYGICV